MAIGNNNTDSKYVSPFLGYTNYDVQVYTKGANHPVFKISKSFRYNEPTRDFYETDEEFEQATQAHAQNMEAYNAFVESGDKAQKKHAWIEKQMERAEELAKQGKNKSVYASYPIGEETQLDGVPVNLCYKYDEGVDTNKVYLTLVDHKEKEVYRLESSFSKAFRDFIDAIMGVENLNQSVRLKFRQAMKSPDFTEPLMRKVKKGKKTIEKPIYNAEVYTVQGGSWKKVRKVYDVNKDKQNISQMADKDAFVEAMQMAYKKVSEPIENFWIDKIESVLRPRVHSDAEKFINGMGFGVSYSSYDDSTIWFPRYSELTGAPVATPANTPNDGSENDGNGDLPF